jgi:acetyl esterase/lipase
MSTGLNLRLRRVRRAVERRTGLVTRRFGDGFRRAVEDRELAISADMAPSSRTLLLAFGGMMGELGVPPFEFFAATGRLPVKRMLVRDLHQAWYHQGIRGHGTTIDSAAASLRELIARHDVDRLVVAGSSAGGYAALIFGSLLGADTVLAFGPQTVLDLDVLAEIDDHRWDDKLRELAAAGTLDSRWIDLRAALPGARCADTRYEIYFAEPHGDRGEPALHGDLCHAERLVGLESVRLYRFGKGGHRIARMLRETGALERILRRAVLADGEQARAQPGPSAWQRLRARQPLRAQPPRALLPGARPHRLAAIIAVMISLLLAATAVVTVIVEETEQGRGMLHRHGQRDIDRARASTVRPGAIYQSCAVGAGLSDSPTILLQRCASTARV